MRAIRRLRHSRQLIEDTFQKPGKQQAAHDDRSRNQRAANCGFHTQSMIGTMQKRLCVLFATQVDNSFSTRISETSACTRLPGKSAQPESRHWSRVLWPHLSPCILYTPVVVVVQLGDTSWRIGCHLKHHNVAASPPALFRKRAAVRASRPPKDFLDYTQGPFENSPILFPFWIFAGEEWCHFRASGKCILSWLQHQRPWALQASTAPRPGSSFIFPFFENFDQALVLFFGFLEIFDHVQFLFFGTLDLFRPGTFV